VLDSFLKNLSCLVGVAGEGPCDEARIQGDGDRQRIERFEEDAADLDGRDEASGVTKPRWLVGEAWPLVRPYTMLLCTMLVMFGFRRIVWMKWLPPSPYISPSPLSAMTVRAGLAALMAVAAGKARPCKPLKTFVVK